MQMWQNNNDGDGNITRYMAQDSVLVARQVFGTCTYTVLGKQPKYLGDSWVQAEIPVPA